MDPLQELLRKIKPSMYSISPEKETFPNDLPGPIVNPPKSLEKISLTLSNCIRIPSEAGEVIQPLLAGLTFKNPAHAQAMRYGRALPGEFLYGFRRTEDGCYLLPRGDLRGIINLFHQRRILVDIQDYTLTVPMEIEIAARSSLPAEVSRCVFESSSKRSGLISAGDGRFERVIVSNIVCVHAQRTLIICQRTWQIYVWRNMLTQHTTLTDKEIGIIGDGHHQIDRPVTIAIQQSLKQSLDLFAEAVGFLVVDGCSYAGMSLFFDLVWNFLARHIIGINSTEPRSDGLEKLMRAFMGDPVVIIPRTWKPGDTRALKITRTKFSSTAHTYAGAISDLCAAEDRTSDIVMDILNLSSDKKARVVVVSTRIEHLEEIQKNLADQYRPSEILDGGSSRAQISKILSGFAARKCQVVLTTNLSLGELPVNCATGVVVAAPFQNRDKAAALVRLMRSEAVLMDYQDDHPMLIASLKKRVRFYGRFRVLEQAAL